MPQRTAVALGRIVTVTVLLMAPAGLTFLVMGALGWIPVWAVLLAVLVSAVATAVLVRGQLTELDSLAAWIRSLAYSSTDAGPPPGRDNPALAETVAAVGSLRRAWQQKSQELAEAALRNESLLDNLPDPLLLLDGGRRVSASNRAARTLFGDGLVGRDLAAFLRDPLILDAVQAVGSSPERERECELTMPVPPERVFQARVERLDGQPSGAATLLLTLHDLTAVKRMERMRADFVANASHELRTPLAALSGFIETLQGPARDDAEAREHFLGIMSEQAGRMGRLVADLLSLSRIELNEHTLPSERVELPRLLSQAAQALKPLAAPRGMEILVEAEADLPPVTGQPDELAQLFQNLVDNAVKYGRDGSTVSVAIRLAAGALPAAAGGALRAGPVVVVSVSDQGDGIAREHLPRLTERFYRVDTARSRKMGGTGLGLAIVKHIVNRHRGLLTIESQVGEGSVFTVWLPASPA